MRHLSLGWTIILLFSCLSAGARAEERFVTFQVPQREALSVITHVVSIDRVEGSQVWAYASDAQLATLRKMGYTPEILPHPGINPEARMFPSKRAMTYPLTAYPTYAQYVQEMQDFAANYPSICQLVDFGDSTNTIRPHDLLAVKITDNPSSDEDEPEVFLTSTMHGDETTGYILMLDLINELLSHYDPLSSDPYVMELTDLVDSIELWINPLANPDGTYYAGDTSVSGAIRSYVNPDGSYSGVDPNRNFPDPDDGPHPDGHPYWQETVAMMDFADAHDFILSANFHGGEEVANYPWDTWARLHVDDLWLVDICRFYADTVQSLSPAGYFTGLNNGITNGYAWYEVAGGRQDFMTYWYGCREITFEVSNAKTPAASTLVDYWDWHRRALLDYIKQALEGVRGIVTDPTDAPLAATIEVLGHDIPEDNSYVYTDPTAGDYHRMLLSGNYVLRVSAYGYITQDTPQFAVVEDQPATRVDVTLEPATTVTVTGTVTSSTCGSPIEGATITLIDTPLSPVATQFDGTYAIDNVLEDVHQFRVEAFGFLPVEEERWVTTAQTIQNFALTPIDQVIFSDGFESGDVSAWTTASY